MLVFLLAVLPSSLSGAVPAVPDSGPAAENAFVAEAARLFFPGLAPGQAPGVFQRAVHTAAYKASGRPSSRELDDSVRLSPLTNRQREAAVVDLFRRAGAENVYTQPIGRSGQNNVIVIKPGLTDRTIVIGAHHDKVRAGHGTIDNWTGAAMVTNLYKAMKDVKTEHTLVFVTFGAEESGFVGSEQFVSELSDAVRGRVDAMLNFDCLGMDGTFIGGDSPSLQRLAQQVAKQGGHQLSGRNMDGGSDHQSFLGAGIPAIAVSGASPGALGGTIHSPNDTYGQFDLQQYEKNFDFSLDLLKAVDRSPPQQGAPGEG
jgi:hypothetical protein